MVLQQQQYVRVKLGGIICLLYTVLYTPDVLTEYTLTEE